MTWNRRAGWKRLDSPSIRVGWLAVALCGVGLALLWSMPATTDRAGGISMPWWSLAIGFALAELIVVHIELRNQAHTLTLLEIPLIFGLFFATPGETIAGRLVGAGAVLLLKERQAPLKVAFNLSLFLADTAVALAVFNALAGSHELRDPQSWLSATAAVAVANVLGAGCVALVIRWHGGTQRLGHLALASALTTFTNTSLAINAALLRSISAPAVVVLIVIVALSYIAYRGYVALRQRYANITALFTFTRIVNDARDPAAVLDAMLEHTCGLLRAERADITLFSDGDEELFRSTEGGAASLWASAADLPQQLQHGTRGDRPTLVAARGVNGAVEAQLLQRLGATDAMATTLTTGDEVIGIMVVAQRTSEFSTFDADDGRAFATLADHASVAIENSRLLERLSVEAARRAYEARHDALTGLVNRFAFTEQLQEIVGRVAADDAPRAAIVVTVDVRDFSEINETLGHQAGDVVLTHLADRLRTELGPAVAIGRIGADVFAWCCEVTDRSAVDGALRLTSGLIDRWLAPPVHIDGIELHLDAAVGVVIVPDHGSGAAKLLQRADVALSEAKRTRRRVAVVYDETRDLSSLRRLALASSLREAIDTGQITVAYQPKMSVDGLVVTGTEALARWQHPVHGIIAPDEFIHLAERTGLIVDLTIGVMRQSLRRQQTWRDRGLDLSMAVNVSTRALLDRDFPARILELLREEAGESSRLTVEVTESVMMAEPDRMIASLDRLAETGITISIDDFGTGYSSLAYLHRLPASEVKIDKSLAAPITRSPDAVTIVTAIIRLAHSLGLTVVAEGIEDQQTWDMLASLGCDLAQGYHVAAPLTPEEFDRWLASVEEGTSAGKPSLAHLELGATPITQRVAFIDLTRGPDSVNIR